MAVGSLNLAAAAAAASCSPRCGGEQQQTQPICSSAASGPSGHRSDHGSQHHTTTVLHGHSLKEHLERKHHSHRAPWLRAFVLGASDGLVSTAALLTGVGAAHMEAHMLITTGVAGALGWSLAAAAVLCCWLAQPLQVPADRWPWPLSWYYLIEMHACVYCRPGGWQHVHGSRRVHLSVFSGAKTGQRSRSFSCWCCWHRPACPSPSAFPACLGPSMPPAAHNCSASILSLSYPPCLQRDAEQADIEIERRAHATAEGRRRELEELT